MEKHRLKYLLMIGVGFLVAVSITFIVVRHHNSRNVVQDTVAGFPVLSLQERAHRDEVGHILPAADVLHTFDIQDKSFKTHTITDEDLSWLLAGLKANSLPGDRKELARVRLLDPLHPLINIPPAQREKIFEAVLPMLGADPAFADPLDKSQASNIMRLLNDKRAVPYLMPLLTYPNEQVREHAQDALDAINKRT